MIPQRRQAAAGFLLVAAGDAEHGGVAHGSELGHGLFGLGPGAEGCQVNPGFTLHFNPFALEFVDQLLGIFRAAEQTKLDVVSH